MKTIKLYHGTKTMFDKVDVNQLCGFSEGFGIYMTTSPTYAVTYTKMNTHNPNSIAITLGKLGLHNEKEEVSSIHEVEVPADIISSEYSKHIPFKDFYSLYKKHFPNKEFPTKFNFNQSDFHVFNDLYRVMNVMCFATYDKKYSVRKDLFNFMVEHGYHVIKVEQPTRNMVKEFYLMFDIDMFNNGKVYMLNEIK